MKLRLLKNSDSTILKAWLEEDEYKKRLSGIEPVEKFIEYIINSPDRAMWIAYEGDEVVGEFDVEFDEDGSAWIAIATAPEKRRQGFGTRILSEGLLLTEMETVKIIKATVEPDNEASQLLFQNAGFVQDGEVDEEGFLHFVFYR